SEYTKWGIAASQVPYGTWVKWVRGPTYMDLVSPRLRTLEATMLGWSPGTNGQWVEGEVAMIPPKTTPEAFAAWLPTVRGQSLLASPTRPTCRLQPQVQEFADSATKARLESVRPASAAAYADRSLQGARRYGRPMHAGVAAVLTPTLSKYP